MIYLELGGGPPKRARKKEQKVIGLKCGPWSIRDPFTILILYFVLRTNRTLDTTWFDSFTLQQLPYEWIKALLIYEAELKYSKKRGTWADIDSALWKGNAKQLSR